MLSIEEKKDFIKSYKKNKCVFSTACRETNLNPTDIQKERVEDPLFNEALTQMSTERDSNLQGAIIQAGIDSENEVLNPTEEEERQIYEFLKNFRENKWNIAKTAESVGIKPSTVRKWRKKYQEFDETIKQLKEDEIDYVEDRLFDFIEKDNKMGAVCTMFYLKTQGQDRGWVETRKVDTTVREIKDRRAIDAILAAAKKIGIQQEAIDVTPVEDQPQNDDSE